MFIHFIWLLVALFSLNLEQVTYFFLPKIGKMTKENNL